MRALVLERRGRHAIVLLPGGELRRVPAGAAQVGDQVQVPGRRRPRPVAWWRPAYAAGALALVLAFLPTALPLAQAKVAAYVTVDINPSVEFGVSASGTVLQTRGLDAAGRRLLARSSLRGEPLATAVGWLLRRSAQQGYLPQADAAAVIVAGYAARGSAAPPSAVESQMRATRAVAQGFLRSHRLRGVVSAMVVPGTLAKAAAHDHVSAGVYALYSALHAAGSDVQVADLRGGGLGPTVAKVAKTAAGRSVLGLISGGRSQVEAPAAGGAPKAPKHPGQGLPPGHATPTAPTAPPHHQGHPDHPDHPGQPPTAPSGGPAPAHGPTPAAGAPGQGVQVQILTPGGSVQLEVGGGDEGQAGPSPESGHGHQGGGRSGGGSTPQPAAPGQGGSGEGQGNAPGQPGGQGHAGRGGRGAGGSQGPSPRGDGSGSGPAQRAGGVLPASPGQGQDGQGAGDAGQHGHAGRGQGGPGQAQGSGGGSGQGADGRGRQGAAGGSFSGQGPGSAQAPWQGSAGGSYQVQGFADWAGAWQGAGTGHVGSQGGWFGR